MSETIKYNIKEVKIGLRKQYRGYREQIPPKKKKVWDTSIMHNLFRLHEYQENSILFLYASKSLEVDTFAIMERCWAEGKTVVLPRCVPETRDMEFYRVQSREDLEAATFGVLEPIPSRCKKWKDWSRGLCVVPGLAFDAKGFRLGYGMGYYDRFLSSFRGETVGLCYAGCVQWALPHGYFDRPVDVLVTENYIRRNENGQRKGGAR